jgi:outer membrane beta-barrel protein
MFGALAATPVAAQDVEDDAILQEAPNVVIQNRRFNLGTELALTTGVLPLDPFYRSLHAGGRMALHLDQHSAIEVGGLYAFNVTTSLRDQLRDNFAIDDSFPGVERPVFMVDGAYVSKPFYGKLSLFNRSLLYNELYLTFGGAAAVYQRVEPIPFFGPGVGGGVRVFLNEYFSLRLDLRHFVMFGTAFNPDLGEFGEDELLIENVMNFSFSLALNFGGD